MKDYTWFFRGVQSAIFLYASCGPCYGYRDQKKRRKNAKRSQAEKQALREADPVANHQPAPFEINPFWHEEIVLGPGPPARRVKRHKQKEKPGSVPKAEGARVTSDTTGTARPHEHSSHGKRLEAKMEEYKDRLKTLDPAHLKESWHNRRQRRDEEYLDSDLETDDGSDAHYHLRRPSQLAKLKYNKRLYMTRAPPVNDLHPPIVCTPSPHPQGRRWMKEKPPSAAFMAGKEGTRASAPSRTASYASNTHRTRAASAASATASLTRHVTTRTLEDRTKRGDGPETFLFPQSQSWSSAAPTAGRNSLHLTSEKVRVVDYAGSTAPESLLDGEARGGRRDSKRKWRGSALKLATEDGSDTEDEEDGDQRPLPARTTTLDYGASPGREHLCKSSIGRAETDRDRSSTILSSSNSNIAPQSFPPASPRLGSLERYAQKWHPNGNENLSPSLSTRSIASSPTASLPASPIQFQARTHSTSITSAPVSPLLEPQLDDPRSDSKLDQSLPVLTVRDSSLAVLQELVSPSTLLNSKLQREAASEATRVSLPPAAFDGVYALDDVAIEDDENDDGWLWTETGERKWHDQKEARNVRNRWSVDF